jgi:hypothetical protein
MSPRPTMVDVARSVDVSLKTDSRLVKGATNIDPVLGERIPAAIRALGYTRNMAAASLRPGRSGRIVGLVIEDLGNPSYSALARSVEAEVRAAGYLLLSASSEESGAMFEPLVRRLVEQRVDGLIVVPPRGAGPRLLTPVDALPPVVRDAVLGSHDVGCGPVGQCPRPAGPQIRIRQSDLTSQRAARPDTHQPDDGHPVGNHQIPLPCGNGTQGHVSCESDRDLR